MYAYAYVRAKWHYSYNVFLYLDTHLRIYIFSFDVNTCLLQIFFKKISRFGVYFFTFRIQTYLFNWFLFLCTRMLQVYTSSYMSHKQRKLLFCIASLITDMTSSTCSELIAFVDLETYSLNNAQKKGHLQGLQ